MTPGTVGVGHEEGEPTVNVQPVHAEVATLVRSLMSDAATMARTED